MSIKRISRGEVLLASFKPGESGKNVLAVEMGRKHRERGARGGGVQHLIRREKTARQTDGRGTFIIAGHHGAQ